MSPGCIVFRCLTLSRYSRILERVLTRGSTPESGLTPKKILSWIAGAKRPLRWFEIQGAISLNLDAEAINEDGRRLLLEPKDYCASLVEVHSDQTVDFVHSTVRG